MRLRVLGYALAAAAVVYSSLQLIEPPQKVNAYGSGCCFSSSDCKVPGQSCTYCQKACSDSNYGVCGNAHQCPPGN